MLFNYQSYDENPAVLAILATREGTSMTVIDNVRDGFDAGGTWGQRLFFNQNGERCSLTGKRKSDFLAETAADQFGESDSATDQQGLNMVLLIQVPLKQKERPQPDFAYGGGVTRAALLYPMCASDVEEAVIGHGKVEGPFTEIDGLKIERDDRFPIRVTVQFYKATSNGVVSEQDMAEIAEQINRVYKQADYVGSLVVDGEKGRPTEHDGERRAAASLVGRVLAAAPREHGADPRRDDRNAGEAAWAGNGWIGQLVRSKKAIDEAGESPEDAS